ncbi:MAG TPA: aldehyde dehydrogenase family protein [Gammaproteobacteria bacterium]|jgi:lactaldehyde dehydrogenase/glycolaldehyde dehydrogenase|nr:aldehyde dehydrogenase family protein [Gammaproteobacteria bacterium]
MGEQFGDRLMFVDGEFMRSAGDEWIDSLNPANEEVIGRVPAGTAEDVDRAVEAAANHSLMYVSPKLWI